MGRASDDPSRGVKTASRARAARPAGARLRALELPGAFLKSPIAVLVAACTVISTLSVSVWVAGRSGPSSVAIADWGGPSYAQDVSGFHPVTRRLIAEVARAPSPYAVVTPTPSRVAPAQTRGPSPRATTPAPPTPPRPSLSVSITADTTKAHPNQTVTYTIKLTNLGPGAASGVVIDSHVPDGTTLTGWLCGGVREKAGGRDHFVCGALGSAPPPNHAVVFAVGTLAAGASVTEQFWVRIDHDVTHHTDIVDHAHAYAANADLTDSDPVAVMVR